MDNERITWYINEIRSLELDCRDNACRFAKEKGGVRTNHGCRCMDNPDLLLLLKGLVKTIKQ